MRTALIIAAGLLLTGCTSSGPVPTGRDTYMITKRSAGGIFTTGSAVKADIYREGFDFCKEQGKEFHAISDNSNDAIPAQRLPNAEVRFRCLDRNDAEYQRPNMRPINPDQTIKIKVE